MIDAKKALVIYSGVLTAVVCWFLIAAAAPPEKHEKFDVIDVGRINVREPDGTLRMTISGESQFPGIIVKGKEYVHPDRKAAGMLFFNDEGTENGGLIFSGSNADGQPSSTGSLTFDRYHQDQVVQLLGTESGAYRFAGLKVNDQPDGLMDFEAMGAIAKLPKDQQRAAYKAANMGGGRQRLFAGRDYDRSSELALSDANGRKRLVLRVTDDGKASIAFLGEDGKVVKTVTANGT